MNTLSSTAFIRRTRTMVRNRHSVAIGRVVTVSPVLLSDLVDSTVTLIAVLRRESAGVTVEVPAQRRLLTVLGTAAVYAFLRLDPAQPLQAGHVFHATLCCRNRSI